VPDLIVATPWPANAVETYGAIAPVVVIDMFGQPVDAALMQFAEAVNRTAEAEALRAGFDAEVTALREKLGDRLARTTVSIVETWDGTINLVPEQQSMSVVVPALGLVRPPEERGLGDWTEISIEALGGIEADVAILVATPDDQTGSPDEAVAAFMGQPVVQALPVVRAGQMVPVDAREIYGVSWATLSRATSKFGEILMRDDLNRDLVVE
jgi:ABC-type Fe3+-hydroxamate transport system substrate-binding protein